MHFLRDALEHLDRNANNDSLGRLRWLCELHGAEEARLELRAWVKKWALHRHQLTRLFY